MRVIAGDAHGRRLVAPRGLETRPATARIRQSIFSRLAARTTLEDTRVLDVFAGSGSLGIEALSRGAARVVFVDSSRPACAAIERNLAALGFKGRAALLGMDARRALAALSQRGERFDIVFIDAPYAHDSSLEMLELITKLNLLDEAGWLVVRQSERAGGLEPAGLQTVSLATLSGHRIALFQREPASTIDLS
jgi:16S rRNA (guanine(966)-N(2))-methyltransferase RsmD